MPAITIRNRKIGTDHPPFNIAEMTGNHNQSLERALEIVETVVSKAGGYALKIQTYTAEIMTLSIKTGKFYIDDPQSLWHGHTFIELYRQAYTHSEWHKPIFDWARQMGLSIFSTPFDKPAADFLETLGVLCYKIASFKNTDNSLIRKVVATGKPTLIFTGLATLADLDDSIRVAKRNGCRLLILLKCTSSYPASPANTIITTIPHMSALFDCEVGLLDHTLRLGVSIVSVALRATVIEKHITLSRADGGVDAAFSLEPHEMRSPVQETKSAWQALGQVHYDLTENENPSLKFRRSLYIANDIEAGGVLTRDNLRSVRQGYGLHPRYYDVLLGKRVNNNVKDGTAADCDLVG